LEVKDNLKFHSFQNSADIEKDVPLEQPEVVEGDELKLKEATLYQDRVYTVVPKDLDLKLGIMPEDQGFAKDHVIVWETYRDLVIFKEDKWKKVLIELPKGVKFKALTKLPGDAYAIDSIPNTWRITEEKATPRYVE
jgi:hypothetical protein